MLMQQSKPQVNTKSHHKSVSTKNVTNNISLEKPNKLETVIATPVTSLEKLDKDVSYPVWNASDIESADIPQEKQEVISSELQPAEKVKEEKDITMTDTIESNGIMEFYLHDKIILNDPDFLAEMEFYSMKCNHVVVDIGENVTFSYDADYNLISPKEKPMITKEFSKFFSSKFEIEESSLPPIELKSGSVLLIVGAVACTAIVSGVLGKYFIKDCHKPEMTIIGKKYTVYYNGIPAIVERKSEIELEKENSSCLIV